MHIPNLISWPPLELWESRCRSLNLDDSIGFALRALINKADKLLLNPDVAVTQKNERATRVSGDAHYYISLSSYFWENKDDPSAPWIYRDGQYNWEEIKQYDHINWETMCSRVTTFALAWWCTNNSTYINAAIKQIRVWFLNPETYMYPNLDYVQTIPNVMKGSHAGIIDLNQVDQLINCIGLIEKSPCWTLDDSIAFKNWCKEMTVWLTTSEAGKKEAASTNNHGVYYDKILASFAAYSGNRELVHNILQDFLESRIAVQIGTNGEMEHEMSRADAHHYLIWSLNGLISMAMIGDNFGVDLWHATSSKDSSIKKSIEWSIGFIDNSKKWPYPATFDLGLQRFVDIFWRSSGIYGGIHNDIFEKYIIPKQDPNNIKSNILNLINPRIPLTEKKSTFQVAHRKFL
jgi:hypothetical protein